MRQQYMIKKDVYPYKLRVPLKRMEELKELANERECSINLLINNAIKYYLRKEKKENQWNNEKREK